MDKLVDDEGLRSIYRQPPPDQETNPQTAQAGRRDLLREGGASDTEERDNAPTQAEGSWREMVRWAVQWRRR